MPICINPEHRRVRVNLDQGYLIFGVRNPTAKEWFAYKKNRMGNIKSRRGKLELNSEHEAMAVEFVESLMTSVEAFTYDGRQEELTYRDPSDNQEKPLSAHVDGWTRYVPENIKFQVAMLVEHVDLEVEGETEKN